MRRTLKLKDWKPGEVSSDGFVEFDDASMDYFVRHVMDGGLRATILEKYPDAGLVEFTVTINVVQFKRLPEVTP